MIEHISPPCNKSTQKMVRLLEDQPTSYSTSSFPETSVSITFRSHLHGTIIPGDPNPRIVLKTQIQGFINNKAANKFPNYSLQIHPPAPYTHLLFLTLSWSWESIRSSVKKRVNGKEERGPWSNWLGMGHSAPLQPTQHTQSSVQRSGKQSQESLG